MRLIQISPIVDEICYDSLIECTTTYVHFKPWDYHSITYLFINWLKENNYRVQILANSLAISECELNRIRGRNFSYCDENYLLNEGVKVSDDYGFKFASLLFDNQSAAVEFKLRWL